MSGLYARLLACSLELVFSAWFEATVLRVGETVRPGEGGVQEEEWERWETGTAPGWRLWPCRVIGREEVDGNSRLS